MFEAIGRMFGLVNQTLICGEKVVTNLGNAAVELSEVADIAAKGLNKRTKESMLIDAK